MHDARQRKVILEINQIKRAVSQMEMKLNARHHVYRSQHTSNQSDNKNKNFISCRKKKKCQERKEILDARQKVITWSDCQRVDGSDHTESLAPPRLASPHTHDSHTCLSGLWLHQALISCELYFSHDGCCLLLVTKKKKRNFQHWRDPLHVVYSGEHKGCGAHMWREKWSLLPARPAPNRPNCTADSVASQTERWLLLFFLFFLWLS